MKPSTINSPTIHSPKSALIRTPDLRTILKAGDHLGVSRSVIKQLVASANISVLAAFDQWKQWITELARSERTAFCYTSYVLMWIERAQLRKARLADVTAAHVSSFLNAKDHTKFATRRARSAAIRSFFRFCSIRRYINYDPSQEAGIKTRLLTHEQMEPTVKECFTDDEILAVDDYLEDRIAELAGRDQTDATVKKLKAAQFWRAAHLLGRYAGLRLGDVCCLEKASLKDPKKLVVWTDKQGTRVEFPVSSTELASAIALIPDSRDKRYCFPDQAEIHNGMAKRSKLSVQYTRILEACNITGKSYHCLRHTLASELNVKGESLEAIAAALGHRSKKTTQIYIHSDTDTASSTIEAPFPR